MSVATPFAPSLHRTLGLPGRRKVTLVSEIGRGSAATAYRGILETDAFVRRPVAVKLFDVATSEEPETAVLELGRAVQRAANVVHPNAVQTYEMAVVDRAHVAVVMELVEGMTLARLLQSHASLGRRMPLDLALFVTTEIAEALSGARMATTPEGVHAGLAHLDVALHQVLLSFHGEVKLSDFGLAQTARWGSSVQPIHAIVRRSASAAPEMARGRGGDTRSDVFSLGILLREMLVGPRFPADLSDADAVDQARDGHVPTSFVELQLPSDVRDILRRALEREPGRRFSHTTAMAYELRRVALSMGVGDGRMFLRAAVTEQATRAVSEPPPAESGDTLSPPDADSTDEHEVALEFEEETPKLCVERTSGLILKADRTGRIRKPNTFEP